MSADRTRRQVDPRDPYYHPTHVGHAAAAEQCGRRGVKTTPSRIKRATEAGDLAYSIVSGKRAYSEADLDDWLLSLRKPARVEHGPVSA